MSRRAGLLDPMLVGAHRMHSSDCDVSKRTGHQLAGTNGCGFKLMVMGLVWHMWEGGYHGSGVVWGPTSKRQG